MSALPDIAPLAAAARTLLEAITFDDSGVRGQGGNGGLLSRETIRKADELRIALDRLPSDRPGPIGDVLAERARQQSQEGYTTEHDDTHVRGELARGAAAYAILSSLGFDPITPAMRTRYESVWPFEEPMKPRGRRRNLVRACAMLLAEIERLDRAEERGVSP